MTEFNNVDKEELVATVANLMKAVTEAPPSAKAESCHWEALGKCIAENMHERAESPRLTGLELVLLHMCIRDTDEAAQITLDRINRRYQEGCDWYVEKYDLDKLWTAVDPAYDKPEYRERLQELGRPVNVQQLFILMDERNAQLVS